MDSPIKDGSDQKNYLPVEVESTSEPSTGVSYPPDVKNLAVYAGKAFEGILKRLNQCSFTLSGKRNLKT